MTNSVIFNFPFLSTSQGGHMAAYIIFGILVEDGMESRGLVADDGGVFITLRVSPSKIKRNIL